jgi:hypothetical protein
MSTLNIMIADADSPALLAPAPLTVMFADADAPAVLAPAPGAVMLADAGAPAVLAPAPSPDAAMLADAGAPAVVAPAPLAAVLADARAPAVLALAPLVMFALLAPPLLCPLPLPLPPFHPNCRLPQLLHIVGVLFCLVTVRSPLAALAVLAKGPVPAPALPPACATGPGPASGLSPFATHTGTENPHQHHDLPRARRRCRDGPLESRRRLSALRETWRPAHGSVQAGWKGPQVHWAQQRKGVRPTDSPHTGQGRGRPARRGVGPAGILRVQLPR